MSTTILVHASAKSAVRHNCQHGWHKLDVDTSALAEDERELLAELIREDSGARYGHPDGNYDVAPPTQEGLQAHLRARLAHLRARLDESARERAQRLQKSLDAPSAQWRDYNGTVRVPYIRDEDMKHPDIVERLAAETLEAEREREERIVQALELPLAQFLCYDTSMSLRSWDKQDPRILARKMEAIEWRDAEAQAIRDAEAQAMAAWIEAHGSEHLRALVARNFEWRNTYLEEHRDWLAALVTAALPDWTNEVPGGDDATHERVMEPSARQLAALDSAPDGAKLWSSIADDMTIYLYLSWRAPDGSSADVYQVIERIELESDDDDDDDDNDDDES